MPAITRRDIRKAIELELKIRDALDEGADDARALSDARITALRRTLRQVPDDEVFDVAH